MWHTGTILQLCHGNLLNCLMADYINSGVTGVLRAGLQICSLKERGGKVCQFFFCQFLADIYKPIPAGWLPVRLPAINLDTLLRYIMCFAVFKGVKQLWMLAVCAAHSQALTHTAKQQSNRKWELSQGIVNSEPYHEAFVTAAALQCNLSMNYKILTSGEI